MIKITITIEELNAPSGEMRINAEGEGHATLNEAAVADKIRDAISTAMVQDAKPGSHVFIDKTPQPNPQN